MDWVTAGKTEIFLLESFINVLCYDLSFIIDTDYHNLGNVVIK